jgi:hypothetical protein
MFEQLLEAVAASHGGGGSGSEAMLDAYDADLDRLLEVDPDTLGRDELVAFVARLETHKRRVAVLDHQLIATLESRGVARELGCASTATLITHLLRINPGQARARVTAAGLLGPRRGLSGQQLAPVFEQVAAAQSTGSISSDHARVITAAVTRLPDAVRDLHGDTVEADLVGFAHEFAPAQLAVLGRHMDVVLNPDGTLADDADHKRRRDLTLTPFADGSGALRGRLDPETVAALQAVLDSTARPLPAEDGTPDPRTPGQRHHDGLRDALLLALRCGELPEVGGTPVTLVITMTADQVTDHLNNTGGDSDREDDRSAYGSTAYAATHTTGVRCDHETDACDTTDDYDETDHDGTAQRRRRYDGGYARTAHGGLIPIADALKLADQAEIITVLFDELGGVMAYGRDKRNADSPMRRVLAARDKGCSMPGCSAPPAWCQPHHVIEWAKGGRTDIRNLTLLCGFHHREYKRLGWVCHMREGLPYWTPPRWLDKTQTPRLNKAHL